MKSFILCCLLILIATALAVPLVSHERQPAAPRLTAGRVSGGMQQHAHEAKERLEFVNTYNYTFSPVLAACTIPKASPNASGVVALPQADAEFWQAGSSPFPLNPRTGDTTNCASGLFVPPGAASVVESVAFATSENGCEVYSVGGAPLDRTLHWPCGTNARAIALFHLDPEGFALFATTDWNTNIVRWWLQEDGSNVVTEVGSYTDPELLSPHEVIITDPQDGANLTIIVADFQNTTGGLHVLVVDRDSLVAIHDKRIAMQSQGLFTEPPAMASVVEYNKIPLPGARGLVEGDGVLFVNNHGQPQIDAFSLPDFEHLRTTEVDGKADTWGFTLCGDKYAVTSGNPGGAVVYSVLPGGVLIPELDLPSPVAAGISADIGPEGNCRILLADVNLGVSLLYEELVRSPSHSASPSQSASASRSPLPTHSPAGPTQPHTATQSPPNTPSNSPERTASADQSRPPTLSPSKSPTPSQSLPPTLSPSKSPTPTQSPSPTQSGSTSQSQSPTGSQSDSQSPTPSQSSSHSHSQSESPPLVGEPVTLAFDTRAIPAPPFEGAELWVTVTMSLPEPYNETARVPFNQTRVPVFESVPPSFDVSLIAKNATDETEQVWGFHLEPNYFLRLEENKTIVATLVPPIEEDTSKQEFIEDLFPDDWTAIVTFFIVVVSYIAWFGLEKKRPRGPIPYSYGRLHWTVMNDAMILALVLVFLIASGVFWHALFETDERALPAFVFSSLVFIVLGLLRYFTFKHESAAVFAVLNHLVRNCGKSEEDQGAM